MREIPNKPPPPYPVYRQLPKSPPFPSDERIKVIVYQQVEELYDKSASDLRQSTPTRSDATFVKSPTLSISSPETLPFPVQDDSNLFERIIIDCCVEIVHEIVAPEKQLGGRAPIGFFNPPNRLKCYQDYTLHRILKLLNRPQSNDHDESKSFSGARSILSSQVAQLTYSNRRKRDSVDEILIQELYENESRWTNFEWEEKEIRESVPDLQALLIDDSAEIPETSVNVSNNE